SVYHHTPPTHIYSVSLHDALPIYEPRAADAAEQHPRLRTGTRKAGPSAGSAPRRRAHHEGGAPPPEPDRRGARHRADRVEPTATLGGAGARRRAAGGGSRAGAADGTAATGFPASLRAAGGGRTCAGRPTAADAGAAEPALQRGEVQLHGWARGAARPTAGRGEWYAAPGAGGE